ncbi:hypothetical protein KKG46_03250 [Patescibacteria group bacterium]|nr:hypothetical protein [Patescibacteria group bacterium]
MSESSIQDSNFTGSPLMSYGTASRKIRYIKIVLLALVAILGIVIATSFWFLFLVKIPVPKNMAVAYVVTNGDSFPYDAPLNWRVVRQESNFFPIIVGYSWKKGQVTFEPYVIKLASVSEAINERNIWHISANDDISDSNFGTLVSFFGWPWQWKSKSPQLILSPKVLFGENAALPNRVSGELVDDIWYTDWKINDTELENLKNISGDWSLINDERSIFITKYFNSRGIIAPLNYDAVAWDEFGNIDFFTKDSQGNLFSVNNLVDLSNKPYYLPDGDVATAIYLSSTSSMSLFTTSSTITRPLLIDSVSTCPGENVANFTKSSLSNICSWFDNCELWSEQMYLNIYENKLTICFQ